MADADRQPAAPPTELPATCFGCNAAFVGQPHESLCPKCRRAFPTLQADAAIPDEPFIVKDRICLRCHYDLTSLRSDRECPECGTPIQHSLRGNLLRYSTREYVETLYTGVVIAEIAALAAGVTATLGGASEVVARLLGLREAIAVMISQSLSLLATIISAVGWWVLSVPDASSLGEDPAMGARKLLRISIGGELAIGLISYIIFLILVDFHSKALTLTPDVEHVIKILAGAGGVVWLFRFFTSMIFLRTIAVRIPDAKLHSTAKSLMWIGPLITVFTCGLGIIVAYISYIVMMERTRRILKAALKQLPPPVAN